MKKVLITLVLLLFLTIVFIIWWKTGLMSVNPQSKAPIIFVIENGQGVKAISKNLKTQGLIKNQIVFFLLTKKLGIDKKIEAGDYRLYPSMSSYDIAQELTHGILDVWTTFPEGDRAGEIADILKAKIPSYQDSWEPELEKNEGYLFPDTYLIPKDATVESVITMMRANFDAKYATLTPSKSFTKDQIVTIASLIEREAKTAQDRPLVASVIINRLNLGMKLDIDATVQYALGYQADEKRWWKKELTNADLATPSVYNTYNHAGLPPTPISNAGLASLKAAINPANTDYLYYMTDKKGINHYAATFAEHEANIAKYGL